MNHVLHSDRPDQGALDQVLAESREYDVAFLRVGRTDLSVAVLGGFSSVCASCVRASAD